MARYDFLIVGAGLFGAVFAREAYQAGKKALVIDRRSHIAGNVYTEDVGGIPVHRYGAHIFHTDDEEVWDYVRRFAVFNRFTNAPLARYKDELYHLPFNMNTFHQMWGVTRPAAELTKAEIIRLMVGREMTNQFPHKLQTASSEDIMRVEGLTAEYSLLRDVSFSLKKGEILGVAGLDGSGRTELLENIFGAATRKAGKIYKNGQQIFNKSPKESIKNGFALVTEERRATGILGILSVRENTVIASLKNYSVFPGNPRGPGRSNRLYRPCGRVL